MSAEDGYINGAHDWIDAEYDDYRVTIRWHGRGAIVTEIEMSLDDVRTLRGFCDVWEKELEARRQRVEA